MQGNTLPDKESTYCIYTIRKTADLEAVCKGGGTGSFTENTRWVEAKRIFLDAKAKGISLPIVFAPAEEGGGLRYYAVLTDVAGANNDKGTRYSFTQLTRIKGEPPKSTLRLKSNSKNLSDRYIRPYAICFKPDFIKL